MKRIFNNIPEIKPLIVIFGVLSLLLCSTPIPSNSTFLFCLNSNVSPLEISRDNQNNLLEVNNESLNSFFIREGVVDIEPWIPNATDLDRDGDVYLNRIYRAYVSDQQRSNISNVINEISFLNDVKYSENEFIRKPLYTPNDPFLELQCSMNSVKATQAWDFWDLPDSPPNSRHVLLASVDTGVDYTHPDLQNNSWINQGEIPSWMFEAGLDLDSDGYIEAFEVVAFLENENMDANNDGTIDLRDAVSDGSPFEDFEDNDNNGYDDDLLGWDCSGWYGTDDNDPFPKEGVAPNGTWAHGTHVAGILAATTDNEDGMASTSYNAKYISVKVSRENQSGEPGISDGYAGITYAAKAGYSEGSFAIINNSWGGGGYSASENSVINNAQNTYGAVIVGAAGNGYDSGGEEYGAHYPSSYENCVSVCAMGCSYNWGNWATYHYTVDLAAPGESVYSAIIGSGYESWDGSSMASPNAASAIGLLSSYHPDWNNLQLRQRIEESADRRVYEQNSDYETCNGNSGEDCFGKGMVDVYKAIGMDFSPSISINNINVLPYSENDPNTLIDNDNVLNPGESATLEVSLENEIGWVNANTVIATLESDNPNIFINNDTVVYGNIDDGSISTNDFEITVNEFIELGTVNMQLHVVASGAGAYEYSIDLNFSIDISLFQAGFPLDIDREVRSAPIIADFDNDGDNEIVFADYGGSVHMYKDGEQVNDSSFPYDVGDQIWGSISSADLDLDGYVDFVVTSKSGYIYVFDINGLKYSYSADRWLIATPVIGNIDDDAELEIVVGGYQSPTSSSPLFAINHDGTDVLGFPYIVGEKIKSGVAVADMDGNGIDDIVFGTDGDNLYVLLDDLTIAPGFPVDLGNNIQSEPAILDIGDEKIIFSGCKNDNFYAINYSDASLRFVIPTGDDVYTSAAFKETSSGVEVYFGSDDGNIYGIDLNGDPLDGFPISTNGGIVGSIVFADIDNNGSLDLVAANDAGEIHVYDDNQVLFQYFPINYQFPFSSSPMITDYDLDGDLEIVVGSSGDLVMIDYKPATNNELNSWSQFKGDNRRTGFYSGDSSGTWDCPVAENGDLNCDAIINILDIVTLVNIVVFGEEDFSEYQLWSADMNADGIINILDIVLLVNVVVSS